MDYNLNTILDDIEEAIEKKRKVVHGSVYSPAGKISKIHLQSILAEQGYIKSEVSYYRDTIIYTIHLDSHKVLKRLVNYIKNTVEKEGKINFSQSFPRDKEINSIWYDSIYAALVDEYKITYEYREHTFWKRANVKFIIEKWE